MSTPVANKLDVHWDLTFRQALGEYTVRFLEGLKERRILATRSSEGNWVYVPPKAYCERSMTKADEWLEVGPEGVIESFSVVHIAPGGPKPPFVLALIRLDGADGLLSHYIGGVDQADVQVGQRVTAVWRDERVGSILDIEHFAPTPT